MAYKTPVEKKRIRIENSMKEALAARKLSTAFYEEKLEQYMAFYDTLCYLNGRIKSTLDDGIFTSLGADKEKEDKVILNLTAEARRVDTQMMEILKFLGLKPPEDKYGAMTSEDDML